MNAKLFIFAILFSSIHCGESTSFEDQIKQDITDKITTGKCKEFPRTTKILSISVGKIVDIGLEGMTDVSYKFDYELDGQIKTKESAMLYIKNGRRYSLASMGSDCEL